MAHVHGEYLEVEGEEEENVELEMVVEEETSNDIVILPDTISNEIKQKPKEEKKKIVRRLEFKDKKSAGKIVVSDIYKQKDIYIFQNEFLCSNFSTHLS